MNLTRPISSGTRSLRVQRLSAPIGAVITNLNLNNEHFAPSIDALRELLNEHHVVFIRGLSLREADFVRLASAFGPLSLHPLQQMLGRTRPVSVIEDTAERPPAGFPWHTDLSWLEAPPRYGLLQALDIPPQGGDTMWASLPAAYNALSPTLQTFCAQLSTLHCIDDKFADTVARIHGADVAAALLAAHPPVAHPLVRIRPDTGQPSLFLSPLYIDHVADLHLTESAVLLAHLDRVIDDPNIAVRWHWATGDIAIWDESSTVHRALVDHHPYFRRMRRCTTKGGAPRPFSAKSPTTAPLNGARHCGQ